MTVSLVNLHPRQPAGVTLRLAGTAGTAATGSVLTAGEMDARNTFEQPETLVPMPLEITAGGGEFTLTLPAKSVACLTIP